MADKLREYVTQGDNKKLQKALTTLREDDGTPLLNIAIQSQNTEAAKQLLKKKVDPSLTDREGRTALHAAATVDGVSVVVELLKSCNLNTQDKNGDTPLHLAVKNTSVEMVKWLIFAGANPMIQNKNGKLCRLLTKKNEIHQLLRGFNPHAPPLRFASLNPLSVYNSEVISLSILLPRRSQRHTNFVYKWFSKENVSSTKCKSLSDKISKEEEEMISPMVEYRMSQAEEVTLNFPLFDVPEKTMEVVLYLYDSDTENIREVLSKVVQGDPPNMPQSSEDDVMYIAYANVTATLDAGGAMTLVCRPICQPVTLEKGASIAKSVVDDRVQLSIPEDVENGFKGQLQLERSIPIKCSPALVKSQAKSTGKGFDSQGDYVTIKEAGNSASEAPDTIFLNLPLPEDYNGGTLFVYLRTTSVESDARSDVTTKNTHPSTVSRQESHWSESDASGSECSSDVDEIEIGKWNRGQCVCFQQNATSIQVPAVTNKTMTVVETQQDAPQHNLKRNLAKQYRKRNYKKVLFFVAGRPWSGWRECQEILVVVTTTTHLAKELNKHLSVDYVLLAMSGEMRAPPSTHFRISVYGDLFVEEGKNEATLTLLKAVRRGNTSLNHAVFVLNMREKKTAQERFVIHQLKRKRKPDKLGQNSEWKWLGEIPFNLRSVGKERRLDDQQVQDIKQHFSDELLLILAEQLLPSEAPNFALRLGMTSSHINDVMSNPFFPSPIFKCFELIRRTRDRSDNALQFCKKLVGALRGMEWNQQCEWLLSRLRQWPGLREMDSELTS